MAIIAIDPAAIESALAGAGFTRGVTTGYGAGEVCYTRPHVWRARPQDARTPTGLCVKVFTSIDAATGAVRATGEDAIRAALVFQDANGKAWGVGKDTRVHRTGDLDTIAQHAQHVDATAIKRAIASGCMLCRMLERARNMWADADACMLRPCRVCGAPVYQDSGRCIVTPCRNAGGRAAPHTNNEGRL